MIASALLAATVCWMAIAFYCMQELTFLIPYRQLIWQKYAETILLFAGVLFLNLFAFFYLVGRKLFLKDTGQKLAHLEKELRSGGSISAELAERLKE